MQASILPRVRPASATSPASLVVLVVVGVVVSFLATIVISHHRAAAIDRRVAEAVGHAIPSVQYASAARSSVRELDDYLEQGFTSTGGESARDTVTRYRMGLDAALASYRSLPPFPHEAPLYRAVESNLASLDQSLDDVLAAAEGSNSAATTRALGLAHRKADLVDEALAQLVAFDASQGQRIGLAIVGLRRASKDSAVLLSLLSIGLACLATALALSQQRKALSSLEANRRDANQRADRSEERASELEQFAGRVAHDLKNPLQTILLRVGLAEQHAGSPNDTEDMLHRLRQQVVHMDGILEGLLGFARAGARANPDAAGDLRRAIDDTVANLALQAAALHSEITVEPFAPCRVFCSEGALMSVLENLLQNALKFLPQGSGPVRRIWLRVSPQDGVVRVEVADTGPGIDPARRATIFQPALRGRDSGQPGIGLGLATVRKIVEAHDGRVGCEPRVGGGSCFWFELPRARSELRPEPLEASGA